MDIKQLLIQKVKDMQNIEFAYLFGSYNDASFTSRSDVDIAVYLKETGFDNELALNFELSKFLKKDVDLLVLNRVKNLYLVDNIITKASLIKDSDARVEFELKKHHQYLDFVEFKKRIHAV